MMEQYIRQVKKYLVLPPKQKQEVLRDLREAFASAAEHGEPEQQVEARFGAPADFADSINAQFGLNRMEQQQRKRCVAIAAALVAAAAFFAVVFLSSAARVPASVIGQADAMTGIQLSSTGPDPLILFAAGGFAALAIAVLLFVQYRRAKSGGKNHEKP